VVKYFGKRHQTNSDEVKLRSYCSLFEEILDSSNGQKVYLFVVLGTELQTLNPPIVEHVRRFSYANQARLAQILNEGKDSGEFSCGDIQETAAMIFALLKGAFLLARLHGGAATYQAIIEQQLMQLIK